MAVYQNTGGTLWNIGYVEPKGANWSDSNGVWQPRVVAFKDQVAGQDAGGICPPFWCPVDSNKRVSYKVQTTAMTGYLFVVGYYDPC
jgi:hypothetical protein